jgi:transglutaminase-like putative cysteine protease
VVWKNEVPEQFKDEPPFQDLTNIELTDGEPYYFFPREDKAPPDLRKPLPSFRIRGASKSSEPLPLPGNAETLQEFDLDAIEFNRLGTVRVFPKKSIIGGIVRWKDANEIESPPSQEIDLGVPELEEEIIEETVEMLGLRDLPTANAKIARIHQWFGQEFTYTRYLDISPVLNTRPSAIGIFLTTSKRGHCEYFATAATLLLRAAGVPARYCVGFSVMEKDFKRNEYIIRGTHGHAWCRVWDGERWIDFDATPSGWLALETGGETQSRWLADTYQRLKEDFFLWRNRPTNRTGATIVMWLIGLSVLTFVARRLWKSKVQLQAKAANPFAETPAPRTPLHNLESPALRILGPRPAGMTFSNWLVRLSEKNISTPEMDEAIALHQRMRFDPEGVPNEAEARLGVLTKDLEKLLKQNKLSAR